MTAELIALVIPLGLIRSPLRRRWECWTPPPRPGSVALVVALIALQAFTVTQLGLRLGSRLSERLREIAERLAGIALSALAIVLLAEKLFS